MKCRSFFMLVWMACYLSIDAQDFDIYVSDAGNFNNPPWQILKYDQNGENPEVFTTERVAWPQDVLFLEDKNEALITNLNTGSIARHNATTGEFINNFATGLSGPTRLKIGPDGLIYVLQWGGTGRIVRFDLNGVKQNGFSSKGVIQSIGIDWDKSGNLYVSSYSTDDVRKYSPSGDDLGLFITSNLVGPTNIWFVGDELYVLDYDGGAIKKFDSSGAFIETVVSGLRNPEGVDHFEDGSYLVGDGGTGSVKLFDADDNYVKDLVPPRSGGLIRPNGVTIRKKNKTSTGDVIKKENLLLPSIGNSFKVSRDLRTTERVSILTNEGDKVTDIQATDNWQAENVSPGIYNVVLEEDGHIRSVQKIVVIR